MEKREEEARKKGVMRKGSNENEIVEGKRGMRERRRSREVK